MVRLPCIMVMVLALAIGAVWAWWLAEPDAPPAAPVRHVFSPVSLDLAGVVGNTTAAMPASLALTPWNESRMAVADGPSDGQSGPASRRLELRCITTVGYPMDVTARIWKADPATIADEQRPAGLVWSGIGHVSNGPEASAEDNAPTSPLPPTTQSTVTWMVLPPTVLERLWVEVTDESPRLTEQSGGPGIVRAVVAPALDQPWTETIELPVRFGWIEGAVDWGDVDPRESSWCSMTLAVNGQTLRLQPASPPAPDGDDDLLPNSLPTRRSFIVPRVEPGLQRLVIRGKNGDTEHFETRLVDVRAGETTTLAPITVGWPIVLEGQVLDPEQLGIEACIRLGPALPGAAWVSTTEGRFSVSGELSSLGTLHVVPDDRNRFAEMDVTCPPLPARDFRIRVEPRATPPLDLRFRCRDELGNPVIGTLLVTLTRDRVTTVRWVNPGSTPRRCPGSRGCSGCGGWGTEPSDLEKETSFPGELFDLDPGDHEVRVWHPGRHLSTVTRISLPRPTDEPVTFVLGESQTEFVVPEGPSHVLAIVPAGCEIRQQTWMDQDEDGLSVPRWGGIEARLLRGLPTGDLVDIYTSVDSHSVTVQRGLPAHLAAQRVPE